MGPENGLVPENKHALQGVVLVGLPKWKLF